MIDGVRLTPEQAEFVRGAVEGADAVGVIAQPSVRRPVRDLSRGERREQIRARSGARGQRHFVSVRNCSPLTRISSER